MLIAKNIPVILKPYSALLKYRIRCPHKVLLRHA